MLALGIAVQLAGESAAAPAPCPVGLSPVLALGVAVQLAGESAAAPASSSVDLSPVPSLGVVVQLPGAPEAAHPRGRRAFGVTQHATFVVFVIAPERAKLGGRSEGRQGLACDTDTITHDELTGKFKGPPPCGTHTPVARDARLLPPSWS